MKKTYVQPAFKHSTRLALCAMAVAGIFAAPLLPASATGVSDTTAQRPSEDRGFAMVVLSGDPLSTSVQTKPAKGKKIDFNNSSVKSYRAQLSALRNDYKQWLRANVKRAKVTGEYDIALNAVSVQLNGSTLAQVAASPLVANASYQGLFYPVAGDPDPDLGLIRATEAWAQSGGAANAGAGVKVAVIDTGIDITHPCFSDAGYAAQVQIGDRRFTNNKVIAAKVFNNRLVTNGLTAAAIGAHGTHVSGTVACNFGTTANVDGVVIPYAMSGVAPRALLGNYNVFPGEVGSARSEDIFNAMEAAYQDGFDVANMSLGGGQKGVLGLEMQAVNNLDQANMVIAVAAGNEGPGYGTVGSPGSAARALTAGAAAVGHKILTLINSGGVTFQSVKGEFGAVPAGGLTAPLSVVLDASSPDGGLSQLCSPVSGLGGAIALISRGTCAFTTKLRNAQAAGAVGAIIVNRVAGDPFVMGQNGDAGQPTIPGYMVGLNDRAALMGNAGMATTIPELGSYVYSAAGNDIIAGFSSWGPTAVDARIKPDVVAPGANILSSVPASACATPPCFAFYNGTSMATPHLAGSAAVLRAQHPIWSAADVRSAIVNTALRAAVKTTAGGIVTDVNVVGAGREDLVNATNAAIVLDPVSVSFGLVPNISGQTRSVDLTLRNVSGGWKTLSLATSGGDASVSFGVSASLVTLGPDASTTVTVSMSAERGGALGHHQGFLEISESGVEVAHAALFTVIK